MKKKYISILDVLSKVQSYFKEPDADIRMQIPQIYADDIQSLPAPFTLYNKRPSRESQCRTLFLVPQTEEEAATQFIQTNSRYSVGELRVNQVLEVPYILEMELLKNSEFQLCETELQMLHRMMMLHIILWYKIQQLDDYALRSSANESSMLSKLAEEGLIRELDLESEPNAAWHVAAVITEIYQKKFSYQEKNTNNYGTKFESIWGCGATSTIDILMTYLRGIHYPGDKFARLRHFLCYVPFFMIFFLLEKQSNSFQSFTYKDYKEFKEIMIEITREADSGIFTSTYDFSYEGERPYFTYAVDARVLNHDNEDDIQFIGRILCHVLEQMRVQAMDVNTPFLSAKDLQRIPDGIEKMSVLLNAPELDWEKQVEDEDE